MSRTLIPLAVIIIFYLVCTSCYYDNEEALYPSLTTSCDTSNVTFNGTIVPILSNNCYSCHSNTTAAAQGNNIRLENYSDVVNRAVAVAGAIKHSGSYSPMPKNGGMLKPCSISLFDIWIRNGMLNNWTTLHQQYETITCCYSVPAYPPGFICPGRPDESS